MIRKDIAAMSAYIPVASLWDLSKKFKQKPEELIKLDANENQLGYSPSVAEALENELFNFYPDPEYKQLREALSSYTSVPAANIMVGSGSDELLDLLFRLILNEGDKVINCPPTFGMYAVAVELNKGRLVSVQRKSDFSLDLTGIAKAIDQRVKAIVVCTPNNPTGTVTSQSEIITLLETDKLVIVDEAYFEFCGKTVVPLLQKYPNLIILRTLSKWAGLAGLRLGYGLMDAFFVQQLFKIKPPYNVNLAANVACIAALKDKKWRKKNLQLITSERERLTKELSALANLQIYPSQANSLFIKVERGFDKLREFLEQRKIVVRYYDTYQAIRLSVGLPWQNNAVIEALKDFVASKWDAVIFDMDGVLVDVSNSYRQAIKLTAEYVLQNKYGSQISVTNRDIEAMKAIPGFNNDWDLSFALIELLSKGINRSNFKQNISVLSEKIKTSADYLAAKDIFQSYYLGSKLFKKLYQKPAPVIFKNGLIENETLLLGLAILKKIAQKYKVGIATGRPKFEAFFALKNLKISSKLIEEIYVVGEEDVKRGKPFPDSLLKAAALLDCKKPIYVGDSVNDVLAAKAAKMSCIFLGENKQADFEIKDINQIKGILL